MESVLQEKINMYDLTQKDLENIYKVADKDIFDTEDNCFFIDLSNEEAINQEFTYLFYDMCETEQEWLEMKKMSLAEKIDEIKLAVHIVKIEKFPNGTYLAIWK